MERQQSDPEVLSRPGALPDVVLRYAAHADAVIDLHLPPRPVAAPPLVVLLHGGFWRERYDRRHTRPLAAALAAHGALVATPEYRRVGGSGGWPTTFDDVSAAVDALPRFLQELGLTVGTTTVAGHSAGGHLALWLANEPHHIQRVVGLAPVGDLAAAARDRLGDGAVQALLGGQPAEVPDRYTAADPAVRLRQRPPAEVVLVHGTKDVEVPIENSRGLAARHPHVRLVELDGMEHFGLIDPDSEAWPSVRDAVLGKGAR